MPRRLIVLFTAALVLLAPAASARAGWIGAQPLDGPNADVVSVGNVDLARDATGALAYIRNADGVPQAYVSRLFGGGWLPVERVSFTPGSVTEVKVAVGDGNRVAVAWIADGTVYATVVPGGGTPGAFVPAAALGGPGARASTSTSASTAPPTRSGRRAATSPPRACRTRPGRASRCRWTSTSTARRHRRLRPKVAVSAEGYAVATWGEVFPTAPRASSAAGSPA